MNIRILLLLVGLVFALPGRAADTEEERRGPPATLSIYNREIAVFRGDLNGSSPSQRLGAVRRRLASTPEFALFGEIRQVPITIQGQQGITFYLDSFLLFALFESDLDIEAGDTLESVTASVVRRLQEVQEARRAQRRPSLILRGIGIALAITLAYALFIAILKRVRNAIEKLLLRQTAGLHWLKFREFDMRLFLLQGCRRITSVFFYLGIFVATYIWLATVLTQFPYTNPWAKVLGTSLRYMLWNVMGSLATSAPGVFIVVVIFVVTRWTANVVSGLFKSLESTRTDEGLLTGDTARATRRIAVALVWIAGVVVSYPYIPGSGSEAFTGISVLLGLMFSLGSTGVVSQLMSGFVVLYSGAIRTGEYAQVGSVEGLVTDISLLSTKVLTPRNEYVTVPNSVLVGQNTINYSRQQGDERTEISTTVTIGYDTPWRQVEAMLLQAANRTPGIRKKPPARVLQTALSDFYVEYELRFVPGDIRNKRAIMSVLHQRILDAFNEYGVQIMSPNFVSQPGDAVLVPKDRWTLPPAGDAPPNTIK